MSEAPAASTLPAATAEAALLRDITLDLADAARQFALLLLDRANQTDNEAGTIRLAAAFERISRAARRAILLNRHLAKPAKPQTGPARPPSRARPPSDLDPNRAPDPQSVAKSVASSVAQAVSRAIAGLDPSDAETSFAEVRDRLDALDADPTLFEGPLQPIIEGIKRDLRRAFDECSKPLYKPRTPEDLARIQAAAPDPDTG